MVRLFAGLPLPGPIAQRLSLARGGLPGARWVEPEAYHVTLRFFGEVEGPDADRLAAALEEVPGAPFEAVFTGYDAFGGEKPRSVHARLASSEPLDELQARVEGAARIAGLPPESRRFVPHVTLAYLKGARPEEVSAWIEERGPIEGAGFAVDRFVLFTARPGGGGPYGQAAVYPLEEG